MRRHLSSATCFAGIWTSLILFAGSDGDGAPGNLVPVNVKVTNEGKPMAGVVVGFLPQGETEGTGAEGVTDENGECTLQHRSGSPGIQPGTYQVTLMQLTKGDGTPVDRSASREEMDEMAKRGVRPKTLATGSAKVTEESEQQLTFDLAELIKLERAKALEPQFRGGPR